MGTLTIGLYLSGSLETSSGLVRNDGLRYGAKLVELKNDDDGENGNDVDYADDDDDDGDNGNDDDFADDDDDDEDDDDDNNDDDDDYGLHEFWLEQGFLLLQCSSSLDRCP